MQLNNEKGWLIKGKTTKSANTFCRNKPNSPIVQMHVTNLTTMNYTIFTSLTKVKNKPNSNPIKPITNPIKAKTKPIQTQLLQGLTAHKPVRIPRSLRHYSLDYLVRPVLKYPCFMSRVNKPTKPCDKEELKCRLIIPAPNPVVPSCLIAGAS
jgi:hypothetical protein